MCCIRHRKSFSLFKRLVDISIDSMKLFRYRNLALGGADESYLSGLYECNEKCGCSRSNCHNRVVQQKMKIPLEVILDYLLS